MTHDLADILSSIDELVRDGAGTDQLIEKIGLLLAICPGSVGSTYQPGVELYRATNHHTSVPLALSELSYPPHALAPMGRANRKGQSAFYCSSDPSCTLLEIGAKIGQLAVHSKWVTNAPMVLHDLGYSQQVFDQFGAQRTLAEHHRSFYESLSENERAVRDFLFRAFTEPTSSKYALTTAIAEAHLRAEMFAGLLYPAMAKWARVDNIALRTEFVDKCLRLESAQLVKIDEIESDGTIGGVILCDLAHVNDDGSLHWEYREKGAPLPPGGSHAIRAGEQLRVQSPGEILISSERYRVEAGYLIETTESGGITVRDLRGNVVKPLV